MLETVLPWLIVIGGIALALTFIICVCNAVMAVVSEWESTRSLKRELIKKAFDFKLEALTKELKKKGNHYVDPDSMLDDLRGDKSDSLHI